MSFVKKRIELASQARFHDVEHLAERVCREVVHFELDECLITDKSDLRDFADVFGDRAAEVAAMLDRFEKHYLVDARAVGSTRIVDLLEYLQAHGVVE